MNEDELDVLVVTALYEERKWLQQVFGGRWENCTKEDMIFQISTFDLGARKVRVGAITQLYMGMPYAAVTTTKAIHIWNPKLVVMIGICAGVSGKVQLGDLVIASQTFDYGSGKLIDGKLHPHLTPISPEPWLWQLIEVFRNKEDVLAQIKDEFPGPGSTPETPMVAHMASMGTGAAVLADDAFVSELTNEDRDLRGVDMEAYAVALAADVCGTHRNKYPCFILKGVVDFAGIHKNDVYHEYGAYVSAAFLHKFLQDDVSVEIFQ